jgi:hypothetical protein
MDFYAGGWNNYMQPIDQTVAISGITFRYPFHRVWGGVEFCAKPEMQPVGSPYRGQVVFPNVLWRSSEWGDLGFVQVHEIETGEVAVDFITAPFPTTTEAEPFQQLLQESHPELRRTISDLYKPKEESLLPYARYLYEERIQAFVQVRLWTVLQLGILGINAFPTFCTSFKFPIHGSPANFAVNLREIAAGLRSLYQEKVTCQIRKPGGLWDLTHVSSDANPLEILFGIGPFFLQMKASALPDDTTLLNIDMADGSQPKMVWETVRNELERLKFFTLPAVPQVVVPVALPSRKLKILEERVLPSSTVAQPWECIPDQGSNRELVRYWHAHMTSKEIAIRFGCTKKTILNRINLLRKEYGERIVPYRRSVPGGKKT